MTRQKILILVGPTASGKSALGVELARRFGGEVISADSRQVYRGLDIGTGKITRREMRGVPHHLLDVASPRRTFTAHDFRVRALRVLDEISARGALPIVVGGTGFYIDALLGTIALPDVPPNKKLRAKLEKKTANELFALLARRDPRRAKTIDRHNKRRLIRALEIAESLGHAPAQEPCGRSYLPQMWEIRSPTSDVLWIGVAPSKEMLEKKIRARLAARMKQGMVAEARRLHEAGLSYKRMNELGLEYRWLARFLQGDAQREEMIEGLARDIIRYAKRQRTYWRRNKDIIWFKPQEQKSIERVVEKWLTR